MNKTEQFTIEFVFICFLQIFPVSIYTRTSLFVYRKITQTIKNWGVLTNYVYEIKRSILLSFFILYKTTDVAGNYSIISMDITHRCTGTHLQWCSEVHSEFWVFQHQIPSPRRPNWDWSLPSLLTNHVKPWAHPLNPTSISKPQWCLVGFMTYQPLLGYFMSKSV